MARIRRNKYEQIEDAFSDLPLTEQAQMLDRLQSLHRWCTRERASSARRPQTGDEAEAAGRAAHAAVVGPAALLMDVPKQEKDVEYREETKQ